MLASLARHFRPHSATLALDDIQATVLRHRPEPYFGTHVMLRIDTAAGGRALIRALAPHVGSAADWHLHRESWIAVALSHAGLRALGLPEASLASFPAPFRQGMAARAAKLRDVGDNDPRHWDTPFARGDLHVALSIFSDDEANWHRAFETARAAFATLADVTLLGSQDFGARPDDRNPFGYRDGISNPAVAGSGVDPLPGQGRPIAAGEFVLGYPSETGAPLAMPTPDVLGRNGTYVVLRKYHSRVGAFNRFLEANAATEGERERLAAKLVGRWRSGAPLTLAPERDDPALGADPSRNNDFTYASDQAGFAVPASSHMRRMNPRDAHLEILTDVAIHRVIRRSTAYGPPYDTASTAAADAVERGLFFIFLSARAPETIEFMQAEWIDSGNFSGLAGERDPILGQHDAESRFTLPRKPVRKRCGGLETFNTVKGGEYLFMPSLSALRWIADPGREESLSVE